MDMQKFFKQFDNPSGKGGMSNIARLLGISRQAVAQWEDGVPELQARRLVEKVPGLSLMDIPIKKSS